MAISKETLIRADFYSWLLDKYVLPTGEKYSFKGFEYLEDICKRRWKPYDQVFAKKPSQVGMSEIALAWPVWMNSRNLPRWKGAGYFFPARSQLDDHVKARFFPMMEEESYFRPKLGNANLRFVSWNKKPIYFRSGQTRRELISVALDCAVIDEFDEFANPITVVPTLEARFGQSDYGFLFGLSTPTVPDIGIDQAFAMSNQYNWYIPCQKCGKDFSPLNEVTINGFENCVVKSPISKEVGFLCPNCSDLTQTNGIVGQWVLDQEKDCQKYAYGISRLFTPRHTLTKILNEYEEGLNVQEFYNSTLGMAYAAANARLTRTSILDLCTGAERHETSSKEPTWAGIDVGKKCHWVVANAEPDGTKRILAYGACSFDDLASVVYRYNVKFCVIDLRPYEQEVKKFIGKRKSFVACDFNTGNQEDLYRLSKADTETMERAVRIMKADKTQACDLLIREIMGKKAFRFPSSTKGDNMFLNQMCAPVRMDKTNKDTGDIKAIYGNGGKADHYFFACLYLLLACQLKRSVTARLGDLFI